MVIFIFIHECTSALEAFELHFAEIFLLKLAKRDQFEFIKLALRAFVNFTRTLFTVQVLARRTFSRVVSDVEADAANKMTVHWLFDGLGLAD